MAKTVTLRLEGESIAAQVFHQKVGIFLDLLHELERGLAADTEAPERSGRAVTWVIESVRSGSPVVMTLRAEPVNERLALGAQVITTLTRGLASLSAPVPLEQPPPYFTFPMLEDVHRLARPAQDGITSTTVSTPEESVTLTHWADANAQRFVRAVFEHYGSVEGVLQMVSVAGGAHFHVRDRLSRRAIRCTVPPEKLGEVVRVFNRRVSVFGRVRTNERGDVLRIHMEEVQALPEDDALPGIDQVAGAFDLTRGKSIEEHLAELRDAT